MKKAILIICVLSVLALLVVQVVDGVLSLMFGPEYLIAPDPTLPGVSRQAGLERPTQTICGYWRGTAPQN
jgi:hypothetical protein